MQFQDGGFGSTDIIMRVIQKIENVFDLLQNVYPGQINCLALNSW